MCGAADSVNTVPFGRELHGIRMRGAWSNALHRLLLADRVRAADVMWINKNVLSTFLQLIDALPFRFLSLALRFMHNNRLDNNKCKADVIRVIGIINEKCAARLSAAH